MNNILITDQPIDQPPANTYALSYKNANAMLPILRSDHFQTITINNPPANVRELKFTVQLTRLLKMTVKDTRLRGKLSSKVRNTQNSMGYCRSWDYFHQKMSRYF